MFLTVDTRGEREGGSAMKDDINATPLEKLIHSKYTIYSIIEIV